MGWSSTGTQQQHGFVHEIIERDLVRSIIGGFCEVDAYHRYGLSEAAYAGSMELELIARGHHVAREVAIEIEYKGRHVCWQRLDMVVDNKVIVDTRKRARGTG